MSLNTRFILREIPTKALTRNLSSLSRISSPITWITISSVSISTDMRKTSLAFVTSCICKKASGAEGEGETGKSGRRRSGGHVPAEETGKEEKGVGKEERAPAGVPSSRSSRRPAGSARVAIGRPARRGSIRTYLLSRRCASVYGRSHSCSISARILVGSETIGFFVPIAAGSQIGSSSVPLEAVSRESFQDRTRRDVDAVAGRPVGGLVDRLVATLLVAWVDMRGERGKRHDRRGDQLKRGESDRSRPRRRGQVRRDRWGRVPPRHPIPPPTGRNRALRVGDGDPLFRYK